jgi:hypothetical protein
MHQTKLVIHSEPYSFNRTTIIGAGSEISWADIILCMYIVEQGSAHSLVNEP